MEIIYELVDSLVYHAICQQGANQHDCQLLAYILSLRTQ